MWLETGLDQFERGCVKSATLRGAQALALISALVSLWALTHSYLGLLGDSELYTVQALVRLIPSLSTDVFLSGTSQDNFTIFSPFYSIFIGFFDVRTAAIVLTVVTKIWFFAAAWALVRMLMGRHQAFFAVSLLVIIRGAYGAYSVFRYGEDFLTARSLAEALVITALALHYRGHKISGFLVALSALSIHPLIALPGVLLLVLLSSRLKWCLIGAAGGVILSLGIACYAAMRGASGGLFGLLDPPWLEVVHERSQFLFPQLWQLDDWVTNGRPFITLGLGMLVSQDAQLRRLCWAAMLVGFTGLLIALIASSIGPSALLLQGQAWRWLWITAFVSVVVLAPTLVDLARIERGGALCSLLLLLGWTFPAVHCLVCLVPAFLLYMAREKIPLSTGRYLLWAALFLATVVVFWVIGTSWDVITSPSPETGREMLWMSRARNVLGLQISAVLLIWVLLRWLGQTKSVPSLLACFAAFGAIATISLPGAFNQYSRDGAKSEIEEFQDWRRLIPPGSNVYVMPAHNSATFAWFTLQRPSYLSVDQSSGVVFSRATALEIKRRSENLLPLMPPDWKLLSAMIERRHGVRREEDLSKMPLTREKLIAICSDPQLGFIVAKQDVGFEPVKHTHVGNWKDWNLYDCGRVRSAVAGT